MMITVSNHNYASFTRDPLIYLKKIYLELMSRVLLFHSMKNQYTCTYIFLIYQTLCIISNILYK